MGMFDYVKCEVPLPDGYDGANLQTKDFEDPYLETYIIRSDGRLIHRRPKYDVDPTGVIHGEVDKNFHGILNFYAYEKDVWREYNAKFTDGQLVGIEKVP